MDLTRKRNLFLAITVVLVVAMVAVSAVILVRGPRESSVELVSNNPPPEGEEDLFDEVNNQSEVGINNNDYTKSTILEAALTGSQTLDSIMDEWNQKWSDAQQLLGVEVYQ